MPDVTLNEWAKEVMAEIQAFVDYWNRKRAEGSPHFPGLMSRGGWDEQMILFIIARKGREL
jgi:hypothetical protein